MVVIWKVIYAPKAVKDIDALPKEIGKQIVLKIREIKEDPYSGILEKMINTPYYKFRVGVYRGIVQIINDNLIVFVLKVKHRSQVYKK